MIRAVAGRQLGFQLLERRDGPPGLIWPPAPLVQKLVVVDDAILASIQFDQLQIALRFKRDMEMNFFDRAQNCSAFHHHDVTARQEI